MSEIILADRWLLWGLVPMFALWVALWWLLPWWRRRRRQVAAVRYSSLETLQRLRPSRTGACISFNGVLMVFNVIGNSRVTS